MSCREFNSKSNGENHFEKGHSSSFKTFVFRIMAHGTYGHCKNANFFFNSLIGPLGFISNIDKNQIKIRPVM